VKLSYQQSATYFGQFSLFSLSALEESCGPLAPNLPLAAAVSNFFVAQTKKQRPAIGLG
jgi:hypothetical protein